MIEMDSALSLSPLKHKHYLNVQFRIVSGLLRSGKTGEIQSIFRERRVRDISENLAKQLVEFNNFNMESSLSFGVFTKSIVSFD